MAKARWKIVCTCGHTFTRATICRKDLRTWDCPMKSKAARPPKTSAAYRRWMHDRNGLQHQTRAGAQ